MSDTSVKKLKTEGKYPEKLSSLAQLYRDQLWKIYPYHNYEEKKF